MCALQHIGQGKRQKSGNSQTKKDGNQLIAALLVSASLCGQSLVLLPEHIVLLLDCRMAGNAALVRAFHDAPGKHHALRVRME